MRTRSSIVVALTFAALALVGCGNSGDSDNGSTGDTGDSGSGRPGVTETEIKVGGIGSVNNPTGAPVASAFDGVEAYFDQVNGDGGIFGRELVLAARRDDGTQASRNLAGVRALVEEDKVFAVLPLVSLQFTGADYLVDKAVPTFGWNINAEWSKGPNLFGQRGSYTCFDCPAPTLPFLAREIGAEKVGVIAYAAPQSKDCATGIRNSFEKYGPPLSFEDTSLPFGFVSLEADIDELRKNGIQFLATCMDGNGSASVAEAIRDADLDIPLYLPNGYDHEYAEKNAAALEGSYVGALFVPFEDAAHSPGIKQFLDAMTAIGKPANEMALHGWVVADLFVTGLRAAGEDFTRDSLVDAINEMTDFDAGGIIEPVDWTKAHAKDNGDACTAFLRIEGGKLVPKFGEPGKPFVCFAMDTDTIPEPVRR